jgi:type VI secretion system secreted protein Hcp
MAIYLKMDGIDGDATHEQHKKWLTVNSIQWGVGRSISTPTGSTFNREASEPHISEVMIAKDADASTPKLFGEACTGKAGKKVVIDFVTTGSPGDTYLQCTLNDTLVSSYSVSSGGDRPSENIGLSFTKMEMKYIPYDEKHKPGSPIVVNYDLTTTKSG